MKVSTPHAVLTLPDGWVDESIVQFASPPRSEVVGDVAASRSRSVMTIVRLRNAPPPSDVMAKQLEGLKVQLPDLVIHGQLLWQHPRYGDAPALDCSHAVAPGQVTRQVYLVVSDGAKTTVCVTFSCEVRAFERSVLEFRHAFESLELVPG
ncbi:MAG: hypothetical protein JNK82_39675 [Myxococcaceae bacterium]|nr:hypothetical protein [Myxococcaceae bacterium]